MEFKVWDKDREIFLDSLFVNCDLNEAVSNNDDFAIFQYIGKTDINDKKIYADSSIVEFVFSDRDFSKIYKGYFSYHIDELRYEINIIGDSTACVLSYNMDSMSDFEIIDTLQENKLGLNNEN